MNAKQNRRKLLKIVTAGGAALITRLSGLVPEIFAESDPPPVNDLIDEVSDESQISKLKKHAATPVAQTHFGTLNWTKIYRLKNPPNNIPVSVVPFSDSSNHLLKKPYLVIADDGFVPKGGLSSLVIDFNYKSRTEMVSTYARVNGEIIVTLSHVLDSKVKKIRSQVVTSPASGKGGIGVAKPATDFVGCWASCMSYGFWGNNAYALALAACCAAPPIGGPCCVALVALVGATGLYCVYNCYGQ